LAPEDSTAEEKRLYRTFFGNIGRKDEGRGH
jgi:hypothetical protein